MSEENLPETADVRSWADAFMRTFGHRRNDIDHGVMVSWFAYAMMATHDECRCRRTPPAPVTVSEEMVHAALCAYDEAYVRSGAKRHGEHAWTDFMRAALQSALSARATDDEWVHLASDCGVSPACENRAEFIALMRQVVEQAARATEGDGFSWNFDKLKPLMIGEYSVHDYHENCITVPWTTIKDILRDGLMYMQAMKAQPPTDKAREEMK